MSRSSAHKWAFAPRFRRHAFGWRSQPAVQRVREAAAEIQKAAKKDPALAAAGAVLFLEKVSPDKQAGPACSKYLNRVATDQLVGLPSP